MKLSQKITAAILPKLHRRHVPDHFIKISINGQQNFHRHDLTAEQQEPELHKPIFSVWHQKTSSQYRIGRQHRGREGAMTVLASPPSPPPPLQA
jgi:hypothetical protein